LHEKAGFNKKKAFRQQVGIKFKEETSEVLIWQIALCGGGNLDTSESRSELLGTF